MKPKDKYKDYIKAVHKGSRDAELENSSGWKAVRKIHKSKRTYNRKDKSGKNPDFFLPGTGHPEDSTRSFSAIPPAEKHFTYPMSRPCIFLHDLNSYLEPI